MDENVCPLCCEELDISDKEFYPCKCGYQVCMWCWHRIRETETGLCPACRTPYGEDPHAFSAVDVEEVLKANKEKERQQQQLIKEAVGGAGNSNSNGSAGHNPGAMEIPKDRTQLANMRVIRRNLVYAVGLPANMNEDVLRKPEYFGQYGKISKMVLNRSNSNSSSNNANSGGGSRATASAYVTFVHKEDTLACILALDGFYLENRNVRASYGTSKYCSAFIKNVRCNNPECTYLHEMGDIEDTFTKQEIQAGYVTSGRDVLARQQQIMAEQMRLAGTNTRKRIGGGGPSGTGRHANNPMFPAPEFDEPARPRVVVPPPAALTRSATTTTTTTAGAAPPMPKAGMAARSASAGATVAGGRSPTLSAISALAGGPHHRQSVASIVAGGGSQQRASESNASSTTTTLTPLTPLKRVKAKSLSVTSVSSATSAAAAPSLPVDTSAGSSDKLPPLRNGKKKNNRNQQQALIGGDLIGGGGVSNSGSLSSLSELNNSSDPLGPALSSARPGALGGQVFTGDLISKSFASDSGSDRWHSIGNLSTGQPLAESNPSIIGPNNNGGSSSSALASILGINLPTGSGSLQESSLWNSAPMGPPVPPPSGPSALSSLNGSALPMQQTETTAIGIGGFPIGGGVGGGHAIAPPVSGGGVPIGGSSSASPSKQSDIALLQSLLPGVNITGGGGMNNTNSGNNNWAAAGGGSGYNDKNWSTGVDGSGAAGVGHHPQNQQRQQQQQQYHQQQQQRQNGPGIW